MTLDSALPLLSPERRADPAGRFLLRPGHGVGRERPWPGPEWGSANCTFRGSPGPGLRTARFLKVRGRGDPDPRGASRTRVARDSRRGARGLPAAGNPSPNPGQTAAPASSRVLGASEEGYLARAAEIRPLFPPGTLHRRSEEADGSPPPPRPPEARAGLGARSRLASAQAQAEPAGEAGRGRGSASRCCPLVDGGRHGTAASTQQPGADWQPPARSPAKRCVFPGPRRARETLRVCLMGMDSWKTRRKVPCTSACTALFRSPQRVQANVR